MEFSIIDSHVHISFSHDQDLSGVNSFKNLMYNYNIDHAFVIPNIEHIVQAKMSIYTALSTGFTFDPYRRWNEYMMNVIIQNNLFSQFTPFFYLPPILHVAKRSIEYYEFKYQRYNFGFKIHNQSLRIDLSNITGLQSHRPMIIHSSIDSTATPEKILHFAKFYQGNILIAHMAKLDVFVLKKLRTYSNVFTDSSIATALFESLTSRNNSLRVYKNRQLLKTGSTKELYKRIVDLSGVDKILFGSDFPACNGIGVGYEGEIVILRSLGSEYGSKIGYLNASKYMEPFKITH